MNPVNSPWRTMAQACAYSGRGRGFLRKAVQAGRLRAARVGGKGEYVFRDEWLDEWLESLATPVVVSVKRRA